ncbi:hypothetical protein [Sphingomonas sp. ABOLE]|uniref:hypothetical protein n=1 Tax=Sphingomonas sp. ABOLE TaxID=1985878 RepID=UPI001F49C905|nr:hypothetical protein [Sphingomonas sp. ABOLE]
MYVGDTPEPDPGAELSLPAIEASITRIAAGLDARFVTAGEALAQAHVIVEQLVAELESVLNALGRDAAEAAIANMQATADRLERLPQVQAARREGLERIAKGAQPLRHQLGQVMRTLDFLRICGLNIRVAAAGQNGFSAFADTMSERLDLGEREIAGIGDDIEQLTASIPALLEVDSQLGEECARVIPQVPRKLAADAAALQRHQVEDAGRAARIADVARDIRTKVGGAIGAMQIGDITRQRLEHIALGLRAVIDLRQQGDPADPAPVLLASGHVLALLAAQAADAIADFHRDSLRLAENLTGIAPSTAALLEIKAEGAKAQAGDDKAAFLAALEQSVADVRAVTTKLRDADARAQRLGASTSASAERLAARLRIVHRVNEDVHLMAWNTDLRCYRLGDEGKALAMVASEIRGFATTLATVSGGIRASVETLVAAVSALRDPDAVPGVDPAEALAASLACIHDGAVRMRAGMDGLEAHAASVTGIIDTTSRTIDCEADFGALLRQAAEQLALLGVPCDMPDEATAALLAPLLDQLARAYTMASERQVHQRFAITPPDGVPPSPDKDGRDDDDGLF